MVRKKNGFTLVELLIAIAIIVILAASITFIIRSGERLAKFRDDQRENHLNIIWHAIEQKIYQDRGDWLDCTEIPTTATVIGSGAGQYDLYSCIYPGILADPVVDPNPEVGYFKSLENYDTGYEIWQNPDTKRISLCVEPEGQGETRLVYVGDSPILLGSGEECDFNYECELGYCVDGFCCNDSCTGDCEACNLTETEGTCTVRNADDNSEVTTACYYCNGISTTSVAYSGDEGVNCTGDCTYCDGGSCVNWPDNTQQEGCDSLCQACQSGVCGYVTAGTDPYGACDAAGCYTGNCDGAGACEFADAGTDPNNACTAAACYTGNCDGSGDCAIYSGGEKAACSDCYYCNDSDAECDLVAAGNDPNNDCDTSGCQTGECNGSGACEEIVWATCGDDICFNYRDSYVVYGTVSSQGECWMDRNLGASRTAISHDDSEAFGDLFQWGRLADGHQNRDSGTTSTLSDTDDPGHNNFILAPDSPYDWRSPQNDNLWQGVLGINNPCPPGWRVPNKEEWEAETLGVLDDNPLNLTTAGRREYDDGEISSSTTGNYWSSSVYEWVAQSLNFSYEGFPGPVAGVGNAYRAQGCSVRCIKE